jgi:hypothetical protein
MGNGGGLKFHWKGTGANDSAFDYSFSKHHYGASAQLSFVVFLFAITSPSYRSRTPKFKITVARAESGTLLAQILTQSITCRLIRRIYVQPATLVAHEDMQLGGGEYHDLPTHQLVSHLLPRKMPSLHYNGKIFSFSSNPKRY